LVTPDPALKTRTTISPGAIATPWVVVRVVIPVVVEEFDPPPRKAMD
jgi:hypothetical protein